MMQEQNPTTVLTELTEAQARTPLASTSQALIGQPQAPTRRKWLAVMGGLGISSLWGCGGGDASAGESAPTGTGGGTPETGSGTETGATASCTEVPSETAGPYPADGSSASRSQYNVLDLDGIVRRDIRQNIDGTGVQAGAMLTLNLHLTHANGACADLADYAVYIWHCTSEGDYSVYTEGSVSKNYLRGVQPTNEAGVAQFFTVMPGCYMGRVPHIHVEIYPSLARASSAQYCIKTTQLAFPEAVMQALYGTASEYADSVRAFNSINFTTDNVFSDGYADQLVSITGDAANGYVANITIAVAV